MLTVREIMERWGLSRTKVQSIVSGLAGIRDPATVGRRGRPTMVYDQEEVRKIIEGGK
jgi:hypothetical protein